MGFHSDREIAIELRRGNTAAWQHVYDEYSERLWWLISRQLNGPSDRIHGDISDVFQESMIAAASSANSYDERKGTIWSWLCGIARNQVALYYRRSTRRGAQGDAIDAVVQWLESPNDGPVEELLTAEVVELVRKILSQLPIEYSELLAARYIDGLNSQALADRNGTTPTAVRSKLARARELFRKTLNANYVLDSRP